MDRDDERALERVTTGAAWADFCKTLQAAGHVVLRERSPSDPLDRAEGYRYLTRLLRAGLEAFVEHADPTAPVLRRTIHETAKMGSDNPDNIYRNATIDGRRDYWLRGRRGTAPILAFATQAGSYGESSSLPPTGRLDGDALEIDDDGTFSIWVGTAPHGRNWLPTTDATGTLLVRETFGDRSTERASELWIEPAEGPARPRPLTPRALDDGLRKAGRLVIGASALFANWAEEFMGRENELPRFDPERSTRAGGDPDIAYYHGYWRLEPDRALVIEFTPPAARGWNFQLNNHWMESLDYRYFPVHVNQHTARRRSDGTVRIVVAHREAAADFADSRRENWLDTCGHRCGTMTLRYIHASEHPSPRTEVVPLSSLA